MRAVLPGKPNCRLQALTTGFWNSKHITAYISGNAFTILSDAQTIIQTIYTDLHDTQLDAIVLDEASGKIATCSTSVVRIYRPIAQHHRYGAYKWELESYIAIAANASVSASASAGATYPTLSWGASQDLLVGTKSLSLYSLYPTRSEPTCTWSKSLPGPVYVAQLSYDSTYIASVGHHDCMVQVWRRLAFGSDGSRFDLSYLRHPHVITNLQWRRPFHVEQTIENVLFTFCADKFIRLWTGAEGHGSSKLHLWGKIDVASSIQETSLSPRRNMASAATTRWAFVVDGRDFSSAVEKAVQLQGANGDKENLPIDHLISIATKNPEVCLVLNGDGAMSAWALENVGSGSTAKLGNNEPAIFNIAYAESPDFSFPGAWLCRLGKPQHVQIHSYCDRQSGRLGVLFHYVDGKIEVYQANVVDLFSPTTKRCRLSLSAVWTGHSAPVKKMVRNYSGSAVVSRTAGGESFVWTHAAATDKPSRFNRQSIIPESGHIHRICVLRKGRFVVFLHHDAIALWDCRGHTAVLLDRQRYTVSGKPLCLVILPRQKVEEHLVAHIATVTSDQKGLVWEVKLPPYSKGPRRESTVAAATAQAEVEAEAEAEADTARGTGTGAQEPRGSISQFCSFQLEDAEGLAYVLPVDPAGSTPVVAGFLDVFARDVAISYTHAGRVNFWTARVDVPSRTVGWLSTSWTETGISEPALVSGSTLKKAALVNSTRSQFTIWDIGSSRLEHTHEFEEENVIRDLDWTSTPDSQSILAVGYQNRVVLLCQMRFDYLNKGPAWAPIRDISIDTLTPHSIGDSTWLGDGHLVIGAGNQMFAHSRQFDMSSSLITKLRLPHRKDGIWDLFEVVQRLNGPLPVFHPQFLSQCILSGKAGLVRRILVALHKALKYLVEDETLDNYLNMDLEAFYGVPARPHGARNGAESHVDRAQGETDEADEIFSEEVASNINERLTKIKVAQLSGHEQIQLADIIECLGMVETQRRSLDENGARFLLFFRQEVLRRGRATEMQISWRDVNWAFHSNSQDILSDFVSRQYHGKVLWENARESAVFSWLSDPKAVRSQFEQVARNEYSKGDDKDPVNCSLFYLALKQKNVLRTLWRMATWHPEQRATYKLLSNDFADPKWRKTAQKNAYALLSRRRFAYAAAFFLLGDSLQDAVNVCVEQLKDLQLAIAIARVYEGDKGPVLRKLVEEVVLPLAAQEGNRWLASWAFWMLRRKDMAVRALITPVYTLLDTPRALDMKSKLFLTDDPALVVLYSQLRQQTLQTLRGASKVTPRSEWEFVLHSAKIYDRMGCDLLGLDLVRNWEFLRHDFGETPGAGFGGDRNPLKLLRRRSSLVVADIPVQNLNLGMSSKGSIDSTSRASLQNGAKPPAYVQEPDPSSILDNFGF